MKIRTWFYQNQKNGTGYMGEARSDVQQGIPFIPPSGYKAFIIEFEVPDIPGLATTPIQAKVKGVMDEQKL